MSQLITQLQKTNNRLPVMLTAIHQLVKNNGGSVFKVGGAVRDEILGKPNKDIDLLVTGIPMDTLKTLLAALGKVIEQNIGGKLVTLKFRPFGIKEEIDIALPRTEVSIGSTHQDFNITIDHTLPIEVDLYRRDFCFNAIAKTFENEYIDPYGGINDLNNKIIRMVNPKAFADDPLRLTRAVVFASRLSSFTIEKETFTSIKENAAKITTITGERILIEFNKIAERGNAIIAAQLLIETTLFQHIFGIEFKGDMNLFMPKMSVSEFIFALLFNSIGRPEILFQNRIVRNKLIKNEIEGLTKAHTEVSNDLKKNQWLIFKLYNLSPTILNCNLLPSALKELLPNFANRTLPYSLSHLAVDGHDLIALGMIGRAISDAQNRILDTIFSNQLANNKEEIIKFLSR